MEHSSSLRDVLNFFVRNRQMTEARTITAVDCDEEQDDPQYLSSTSIRLEPVESDGGAYSANYRFENVVAHDTSVYCTQVQKNVNLLLRIGEPNPIFITHICVRAPSVGFSSPVLDGVVFAFFDKPQTLNVVDYADDWRLEDFHSHYEAKRRRNEELSQRDPIAFFSFKKETRLVLPVKFERPARWILVKLLRGRRSDDEGENIDIQFIGAKGYSAPHSSACFEYK